MYVSKIFLAQAKKPEIFRMISWKSSGSIFAQNYATSCVRQRDVPWYLS